MEVFCKNEQVKDKKEGNLFFSSDRCVYYLLHPGTQAHSHFQTQFPLHVEEARVSVLPGQVDAPEEHASV